MSSFYIPVSALRRQQERLELLGGNIANINTPGYKTGRMTFLETLGTVTGVTRTTFKQGALEFTGNASDLAIQGNGFFVVRNGEEQLYTRAGAFTIDSNGKLVNSSGFALQGWMGESVNDVSSMNDIIIDSNLVMPAEASKNLWLNGNLNASLEPVAEVWSSGSTFTTEAVIKGSAITFPLTITTDSNDKFKITLGTSPAEELTLAAADYADIAALVTQINTQISSNTNLTGKVEAVNSGNFLIFKTIGAASGTALTLNSVDANIGLTDLGFTNGDTATSGVTETAATESDGINVLLQTSTDLGDGDSFTITGTDSDGNAVTGTFTYGAANDGTTLGDLVTVINTVYAGNATAEIVDGKIILTDDKTGKSQTSISITDNSGKITIPSFANTVDGSGEVTTSVVAYDSLGNGHTLTMEFIRTANAGEWEWRIACTDGAISSNQSGNVNFNEFGELEGDGIIPLTITPAGGADEMNISIHLGPYEGYSGVSQYDSASTLLVRKQDGKGSGSLKDFYVDTDGSVIGLFTNGEDLKLGQVALANFNNPGGLTKANGSNYIATSESGIPQFDSDNNFGSTIESGSLEVSTVDMADQFTKMIEAQRAFQASARVISTFDQILDETTRLKR